MHSNICLEIYSSKESYSDLRIKISNIEVFKILIHEQKSNINKNILTNFKIIKNFSIIKIMNYFINISESSKQIII